MPRKLSGMKSLRNYNEWIRAFYETGIGKWSSNLGKSEADRSNRLIESYNGFTDSFLFMKAIFSYSLPGPARRINSSQKVFLIQRWEIRIFYSLAKFGPYTAFEILEKFLCSIENQSPLELFMFILLAKRWSILMKKPWPSNDDLDWFHSASQIYI